MLPLSPNNTLDIEYGVKTFLTIGIGLILPIVLIPVITLSGYSEVVEEFGKAAIIVFFILGLPTRKFQNISAFLFGLSFGVSESILYLNNIFQLGDMSVFWQRLLFVVPLHIVTVFIILVFARINRRWLVFGLAGAIVAHLLFNYVSIHGLL